MLEIFVSESLKSDNRIFSVERVAQGFRVHDIFRRADRMGILDEKLGLLLLQFPKLNKYVMNENEFLRRLRFFLTRLKDLKTVRFVVEIRNKPWLNERLLDVLRENRVALALSDTSFMPRPWEQKLDLITTDFVYVR